MLGGVWTSMLQFTIHSIMNSEPLYNCTEVNEIRIPKLFWLITITSLRKWCNRGTLRKLHSYVPRDKLLPAFAMDDSLTTASRRCVICASPAKKKCAGCRWMRYCSVSCQRQDWTRHKPQCERQVRRRVEFEPNSSSPTPMDVDDNSGQ